MTFTVFESKPLVAFSNSKCIDDFIVFKYSKATSSQNNSSTLIIWAVHLFIFLSSGIIHDKQNMMDNFALESSSFAKMLLEEAL